MRLLQKRRALASGVLGLGAALALAGCGAGQITQTDTMLPSVNGALATVGPISVRNAAIANRNTCEQAYAPGSSAQLTLTIANSSAQDDQLVAVTSDNATGSTIDGQKVVVGGSTLVVGPSSPAESAPTGEASPTTSSSATGSKGQVGRATVELTGIKQVVWPGQTMPITFVFRDAGPVTVKLPIAAPTVELPDCQTAPQQAETGH